MDKFCTQHDLSKNLIKVDVGQEIDGTYGTIDMKENIVSDTYETICMMNGKARTLWKKMT